MKLKYIIYHIKNEKNVGQTSSFQKVFDASNGDFIIRMDSDLQDDPSDLIKFDSKINSQVDITAIGQKKAQYNT